MTPPTIISMHPKDWGLIILLAFLWGGAFFMTKIGLTGLPPLTLVTLRVGFGALALWSFIFLKGYTVPKNTKIWIIFFIMGLFNNAIPFSLIVWGQTQITASLASILNAMTPVFTVIFATTFLPDERATSLKIIGILLGFAGVTVMIGPDALAGIGDNLFAQFAVLSAAASYAAAGILGRKFALSGAIAVPAAAGQITAATLLLVPAALLIDDPFSLPLPTLSVWGAVAGLSLLSTALASILYFKILERAGATNLSLVTFLIPAVAIGLGTGFLGETLGSNHIGGMALIAAGFAAIDGRLIKFFTAQIKKRPKAT